MVRSLVWFGLPGRLETTRALLVSAGSGSMLMIIGGRISYQEMTPLPYCPSPPIIINL